MDVVFGKAWEDSTIRNGAKTGWFVGPFDQIESGLRKATNVEIKWYHHARDEKSDEKPISKGLTVSVLVSGHFRLWFREEEGDWKLEELKGPGDYAIWGPNIYHKYEAAADSIVFTVRPLP